MTQKLSIQQAAQEMDVTTYTLRYYEEIGILPGIQRNDSGHRFYEDQDLGWISWIKLLRSSGMPIETIRDFVTLTQSGDDSIPARCEILDAHRQKIRHRIEELQGFLLKLDDKLQFYQGLMDEA
jgi:DNA-binding transcriptional MerR regulator